MASKRKPVRAPSQRSGFTAVLEAIERQNRVVSEGLTGLRAEVERRFEDLGRRVDARFQTLELAIREVGARTSALEGQLKTLEGKIDALEGKIDALGGKIDAVESEVRDLRREVARLSDAVRGKAEAREVAALAERVARLEARIGL